MIRSKINLPNQLTIFRMILIIPFIIFMGLAIAFKSDTISYNNIGRSEIFFILSGVIFVVAMLTDFLDGYLARKNKQVTTFGKIFDPLADKFMTTSALIMLSIIQIIPFWVVLIFVLRDILVDGLRNLAVSNNVDVSASIWGKAKTMLQSIAIIIIFFVYPTINFDIYQISNWNWNIFWLNLPLIIAMILSLISGYKYITKLKKFINLK